jgi:hypothetical protein
VIPTDVVRTPPATLSTDSLLAAKEAPPGQNGHVERLIGSIRQPSEKDGRAAGRESLSVWRQDIAGKPRLVFLATSGLDPPFFSVRRILKIRWDASLASGTQKVCCSTARLLG